MNRWFQFLGGLASSGAVAGALALTGQPTYAALLAVVPAALAGAVVSFDFPRRAREARDVAARYMEIAAQIEELKPTAESVRNMRATFYRIQADEEPVYAAAYWIAYNEQCRAYERNEDLVVVGQRYRLLKNLLRFSSAKFPDVALVEARKLARRRLFGLLPPKQLSTSDSKQVLASEPTGPLSERIEDPAPTGSAP